MGNLLGSPITEKETHVGSTDAMEVPKSIQEKDDNETELKKFVPLEFGLSSMQGWRVHMEDAHIAEVHLYATEDNGATKLDLPGHSLYAVFDGHGGTYSAKYCGNNFCRVLSQQRRFVDYAKWNATKYDTNFASAAEQVTHARKGLDALEAALIATFVDVDQEIANALRGTPHPNADTPYHPPSSPTTATETTTTTTTTTTDDNSDSMQVDDTTQSNSSSIHDDEGDDSGTTAVMVLVTPDWLVCANAGDSRAVYSKQGGRAVPLSYDHKPDDEAEERRIRTAGGYVAGGRVEGDLAVSRGLGDFRFKHLPTVLQGNDPIVEEGKEEKEKEDTNTDAAANSASTPTSLSSSSRKTPSSLLMNPGDQKVSPIPDIIVQHRNPDQDEFIIVACDGIWDVQTNQECVREVQTMFEEGEPDLGLVCEEVRLLLLPGLPGFCFLNVESIWMPYAHVYPIFACFSFFCCTIHSFWIRVYVWGPKTT